MMLVQSGIRSQTKGRVAMATLRESMAEASRLKRMRQGQEVPEYVNIPSMEGIRVALVPLTEAEEDRSTAASASIDAPDNIAGFRRRDRERLRWNVWQAMRDPGNLSGPLYESVAEMIGELEPFDLESLGQELALVMDYASPAVDGLSPEVLDELKKACWAINWNELSGKPWAAVKLCLSTLLPELLQGKSLGITSTDSSMPRSESDESI